MIMAKPLYSRRKYPRRVYHAPVAILCASQFEMCNILQIGEKGMLFHSPNFYEEGQKIVASFFINGHFVSCQAHIVYQVADLDHYGVEFDSITFEERREVRDYIAYESLTAS